MVTEPMPTAVLLATFGTLILLSVVLSRAGSRFGVPVALVFLGIGMLAGALGAGTLWRDAYQPAFRIGIGALVLILFDGGLNLPVPELGDALPPSIALATVGVVATAALAAWAAHSAGLGWAESALIGAVVSSTDAAAVFSVLRTSEIGLARRVGLTLELESGLNDPVAVLLTLLVTEWLVQPHTLSAGRIVLAIALQLGVGIAVGWGVGRAGRWLMMRVHLPAIGLYPAITVALAMLAYGAATLADGSGFLAVYLAAVILGDGPLPYRSQLLRVHDALAWLGQVAMFLVLGLLVSPGRLAAVGWAGLAVALFLALVARPAVVALCLAPFRYAAREVLYVGWVGLRGAVPIVLATFPVLAGAPGALRSFDVVFFIVVVSAIVPGGTVPWVTRRLGLESPDPPAPPAQLEIISRAELRGTLMSFYIDPALAVAGASIAELPFPDGAAATLIVRHDALIAPKGHTVLEAADHVFVLCQPEDVPLVQLMFGQPER